MKISLNEIKKYTTVDCSVDELVEKINTQLGGVEEVINLEKKYAGVLIANVIKCEKHANADNLHVCKIDDGGKAVGVERDSDGLVQVVCGAPNIREGLQVAWLPPGSIVPASFSDAEPFKLSAIKLRGVISYGMIASPKELDLSDEHSGILELNLEALSGDSFANVVGLDDFIIDIENKMFTHRPDCFGALGVAREISGILNQEFVSPSWYAVPKISDISNSDELKLTVKNEIPETCPRYLAVALSGVTIKPSPDWLQYSLIKLGLRPINNVVDITNYLMLLTAQPTHAYDYDKVASLTTGSGANIVVRYPKESEKMTLLDGKVIEPRSEAALIASDEAPLGLAGVMGSSNSEVDDSTKNIILEIANFDMYNIRRTSMQHGLFTDASTRFTKGQSPLQIPSVLAKAIELLEDISGGKVASDICDEKNNLPLQDNLTVSSDFINQRLGLKLTTEQIAKLLSNVEFNIKQVNEELEITAGFWRTDIKIPEDIVEEVGRLVGFDKLVRELPTRSIKPAQVNSQLFWRQKISQILANSGTNELLTYSFVSSNILTKAAQDKTKAYKIANALSPDLQCYRLSVLPSLLSKVHLNVKAGYKELALFEIGKGHNKTAPLDDEGLPIESRMLDLIYSAAEAKSGAPFFVVRRLLDNLFNQLNITVEFSAEQDAVDEDIVAPFDATRMATIKTEQGQILGVLGELKQEVIKSFKLPKYSAAFSLKMDALEDLASDASTRYRPLSKFPKVVQDVSFKVDASVKFSQINQKIADIISALSPLDIDFAQTPVSIYRPEEASSAQTKTFTFRFKASSFSRTLTDKEISKALNALQQKIEEIFKAVA